jgi:glutathione S-transferase
MSSAKLRAMRCLVHFWFCPASRAARIALKEKDLDFEMEVERIWERREEFLALNPSGEVPVLIEDDDSIVAGGRVILEYLEESQEKPPLLGPTPQARVETRRLMDWFSEKFDREVTQGIVQEKVLKRFLWLGAPDGNVIRACLQNVHYHMDYIGYLTERRRWLAGDEFSYADICAAAHLSCLDYLGDAPWSDHEAAKDWYMRVKSRPSFRPLLADRIAGLTPAKHYADLDF